MEATGEAGEIGRYDESEAVSDGPDELATLPLPFSAAGGRVKPPSNCGAFALLLPVISVEGCGVGGKLGRGISILDGLELTKQRLAAVKLLQKERQWSTEGLIEGAFKSQHYHGQGVAWALVAVEEVEQRVPGLRAVIGPFRTCLSIAPRMRAQ